MYSSSCGAAVRQLVFVGLAALLPSVSTEVAVDALAPLTDVSVERSTKGLCLWQAGVATVARAETQHRSDAEDSKEATQPATDPPSPDHGINGTSARIKGGFHPIGPLAALTQQAAKVTGILNREEPAEAILPTFLTAMVLCLLVVIAMVVGPEVFRYNRIDYMLYRYFAAGGEYQPLRGPLGSARPKFQPSVVLGSAGNLLGDDAYLCPELVVPEDCECSLVIPARPLWQGPLEVTDLDGGTVLLQAISNDEAWGRLLLTGGEAAGQDPGVAETQMERLLTLLTPQGTVLAYCCANSGPGEPLQIAMLRAGEGNTFATLTMRDSHEYIISTEVGKTFRFTPGNSMACRFDVFDEMERKCATSRMLTSEFDARGECYCAQTAPLTDVGLLLCGMLCTCNVLEQNIA